MDARNFTYMFYGFLAAWLIVMLYVISLARRGGARKQQLGPVPHIFASGEANESTRLEERVR